MWRYACNCWGRVLLLFFTAFSICTSIFNYGFHNNLENIVKLIDFLYSNIINLVIFLPSIAFISFGLLPSIGINLKIKLVQKGELNSRKIEGVMDDLAVVFYLSVLSVGISICMKMFWASVSKEFIDNLDLNIHALLIICSFGLGVGLLLIIIERIWMIINTIHSILLGDFASIEKDFTDVAQLMKDGKISSDNYQNAISNKIEQNLEASSIENLQTKIDKNKD